MRGKLGLFSRNVPSDPDFSSVVLLLHMDGADQSDTFTDSSTSAKSATAEAAVIATAQSKFGGASGYFDGISSLAFASSADFAYGTGDFAIEFFVRFESLDGVQGLICSDAVDSLDIQFRGDVSELGLGAFEQFQASFAWSPSVDVWYHVAVTRSGGTVRAFVDGSLIGTESSTLTSLEATSANCLIGTGDGFFTGWLDEVRITKGVARYTAGFTAPTAPFPNA